MKYSILILTISFLSCMNFSCKNDAELKEPNSKNSEEKLFTKLNSTGIDFVNNLTPTVQLSTFSYQYFQNGGGVAVADFNNDGLQDVFFTSNLESDKLYLNKGNFEFEDITSKSKVTGFANGIGNSWSTGVSIGDVNGDGYPDIYICKSGPFRSGPATENLLYVNNRDLTFTERGKEYGINDNRNSTQAVFFDYDNDNDLDLFVLNHSILHGNAQVAFQSDATPELARPHSCSLFRNDKDKFIDVTLASGVSKFSYGLGVVASDLNDDGWVDIYVANDFSRPDFMFVNNGNGTFSETIKESVGHLSYYSMGCDVADINNDGLKDLSVVDMAPANNFRSKTLMPSMSSDNFNYLVDVFKYTHQYMFNALQLNQGNGRYSEIGKLAGVHKTDWSWATLLADFNNDGLKDMFVSNGYKFNKMENDFSIAFKAMKQKYPQGIPPDNIKQEWLQKPPSYKLPNYIFKNENGLTFTKKSKDWGLGENTFSNGAAYADFDNDGDLDLVINNIDDPASVYENNSKNNYLQIVLKAGGRWSPSLNLNTEVTVYNDNKIQIVESTLTRGFQSSVEDLIHFGLDNSSKIDSVKVLWKDGRHIMLKNLAVNSRIVVDRKDSKIQKSEIVVEKPIFKKATNHGLDFVHKENFYDDFSKELLLPHKNSQHGPCIAKGDVNNDGLEDVHIGGAANQKGVLWIQEKNGTFTKSKSNPWYEESRCEDMSSVFFDCDGDGDLDLYIVSGGNEFEDASPSYYDRLYVNNGIGQFSLKQDALPFRTNSGSKVISFDYDKDGDDDLFVGGRMKPGAYPYSAKSQLLINNGKGVFKEGQAEAGLQSIDDIIVTDATSADIDGDGDLDLIVVGEWSSVHIFENNEGEFTELSIPNLAEEFGWWSSIEGADLDKDGDIDFVLGNLGLNYKYKATHEEPFHIYAHDFDDSGSLDIVLGYFNEGVCYPLRGRECSSDQMPFLKEKFPTYKAFASADLKKVYGSDLDDALHRKATNFSSSILINKGGGQFELQSLPLEAQLSSINGILLHDFNNDENLDILIGGNLFASEVETPRNDASQGCLLIGDGNLNFKAVSPKQSGFYANKDLKDLALLKTKTSQKVVLVNNNDAVEIFEVNLD